MDSFFEDMDAEELSRKRPSEDSLSSCSGSSSKRKSSSSSPAKFRHRQASVLFISLLENGKHGTFDPDSLPVFAKIFSERWPLDAVRLSSRGRVILDFPSIREPSLEKIRAFSSLPGIPAKFLVRLLSSYGQNSTEPKLKIAKLPLGRLSDVLLVLPPQDSASLPSDSAQDSNAGDNNLATPLPDGATVSTVPSPAPLTESATIAAKTSPPKPRGKYRYLPLDMEAIHVNAPAPLCITVFYKPADGNTPLTSLHQGNVFKDISRTVVPLAVRDVRGGGLAADFPIDTPTATVLGVKSILDIPVKASLPLAMTSRSGVVHGLHPDVTPEEFISEAASDSEIITFTRLAKPGASSWVAKITFKGTLIPKTVKYAGRSYRVSNYQQRPIQCAKCSLFNHAARNCKSGLRCRRCGDHKHIEVDCLAPAACCTNCGGEHSADSKSCKARHFLIKVAEVKTTANLSSAAAHAVVQGAARSYAAAARAAPTRNRPEPSRNRIFCQDKSPAENANFAADIVAAVLAASRSKDFDGLLLALEAILAAFSGVELPAGTLRGLIAARTPPPSTLSA